MESRDLFAPYPGDGSLDIIDFQVCEVLVADDTMWTSPIDCPRLDRGPAYVWGLAEVWGDMIE